MERNAPTKSPPTSTPYRRDDRPTACCPTICQIEPPPRQCEWSHYPSLQCYFDGAGNNCTFFKNADTAVPREIVEKQILPFLNYARRRAMHGWTTRNKSLAINQP